MSNLTGKPRKLSAKEKKELYGLKPFEGKAGAERHIRITESMLESEAWADIRATSAKLYVSMKLRFTGNNQDGLRFPYCEAEKIINRKIVFESFKDLISHGFIEVIERGCFHRKLNKYKLSDKWKEWQTGVNYMTPELIKEEQARNAKRAVKAKEKKELLNDETAPIKAANTLTTLPDSLTGTIDIFARIRETERLKGSPQKGGSIRGNMGGSEA